MFRVISFKGKIDTKFQEIYMILSSIFSLIFKHVDFNNIQLFDFILSLLLMPYRKNVKM